MFKQSVTPLIWFAIAALHVSCAHTAPQTDDREKILMQGRIESLEAAQGALRVKVASLEESLRALEDRYVLSQRTYSPSGQREVVRIEPQRNKPELSSQFMYDVPESDDLYTEIVISDEKKRAYFGKSTPKPAATSTNSSGPRKAYENVVSGDRLPSANADAKPATPKVIPPANASQYYKEGIDLYRRGLYDEARAKFEAFLDTKPEREYVDNALYWIGECYYGVGKYHEAAAHFHRIVEEYPETNKVPDALLKASLTYQRLGKVDSAKELIGFLLDNFPKSDASRVARDRYPELVP